VLHQFENDDETARSTCAAFGMPPNSHRTTFMTLGDTPTATILDLTQWCNPPPVGDVYSSLSNVGIARIAFSVDNPLEVYEELGRRGYADHE
jgi:hypothetical protein